VGTEVMDNKEINRLVAEKVMGYVWAENTDGLKLTIPYVWYTDNGYRSSFRPSQNIEDAWKVVEKFNMVDVNKDFNGEYECVIYVCDNQGRPIECWIENGETAQISICKAALKSYGISR
jgi:hypothetical protein